MHSLAHIYFTGFVLTAWRITAIQHNIMREIARWAHRNSEGTETIRDLRISFGFQDPSMRHASNLSATRYRVTFSHWTPELPVQWPRALRLISRDSLCRECGTYRILARYSRRNWCTSKGHRYILSRWQVERATSLRSCVLDQIAQRLYLRSRAKSPKYSDWMKRTTYIAYSSTKHTGNYYLDKNFI